MHACAKLTHMLIKQLCTCPCMHGQPYTHGHPYAHMHETKKITHVLFMHGIAYMCMDHPIYTYVCMGKNMHIVQNGYIQLCRFKLLYQPIMLSQNNKYQSIPSMKFYTMQLYYLLMVRLIAVLVSAKVGQLSLFHLLIYTSYVLHFESHPPSSTGQQINSSSIFNIDIRCTLTFTFCLKH